MHGIVQDSGQCPRATYLSSLPVRYALLCNRALLAKVGVSTAIAVPFTWGPAVAFVRVCEGEEEGSSASPYTVAVHYALHHLSKRQQKVTYAALNCLKHGLC